MTLNFQTKSPQPIQYNAITHIISSEVVENETNDDSNDYIELTVRLNEVQLPDLSFSNLTTESANTKVIANAGIDTFNTVRTGDAVVGNEIPASTVVASVSSDGSEIVLDQAPTGDVSSASITITPQLLDSTFAKVRLNFTNVNETDIQLESVLYTFDGKTNKAKRNDSGTDDVVIADANTTNRANRTLNANTYLQNVKG